MEYKIIDVKEDTLAMKVICQFLEEEVEVVAKVFNNAAPDVAGKIIDGILLGEDQKTLDNAVELFNAELVSQNS